MLVAVGRVTSSPSISSKYFSFFFFSPNIVRFPPLVWGSELFPQWPVYIHSSQCQVNSR